MLRRVFGYIRGSPGRRFLSVAAQRRAIEEAVVQAGRTLDDLVIIEDEARCWNVAFSQRPGGGLLERCLEAGDVVLTWSLDRMFPRVGDCVQVLRRWRVRDYGLIVLALRRIDALEGFYLRDPRDQAVAETLAALDHAHHSERGVDQAYKRRSQRQPVNGRPAPGFQWIKRRKRDRWTLVPDPEDRRVMGQLLAWRRAGHTVPQIQHLIELEQIRLTKRWGKSATPHEIRWSAPMIHRRLRAEERLQELEAKAAAGIVLEPAAPKRRGRPRKWISVPVGPPADGDGVEAVPRRRGRPRKWSVVPIESASNPNGAAALALPAGVHPGPADASAP